MDSKQLEGWVLLRDGLTTATDGVQKIIESQEPKKDSVKPNPQEVEKLPWETKQGSKGEYEQTSKATTNNHVTFQALQKYVKDHKGFCALNGWRYWFDRNNETVIDRRKI